MVKILLAGALRSLFIFAPFVAFQAYGYLNICMGHFVAEMRPWCKARLPLLYNYIQSHYWYVTHIIHSITFAFAAYAGIAAILSLHGEVGTVPFLVINIKRVGFLIVRRILLQKTNITVLL